MFANFISKITSRRKRFSVEAGAVPGQSFISNPILSSYYGINAGSYDNNYASIARIAERFATVLPYAVDANGERLRQEPPIIEALRQPNRNMSSVRFAKTLITMLLVHPHVELLCHHKEGRAIIPGGKITADNIAGFTFLGVCAKSADGERWEMANGQSYSINEVISLSLDINPYGILDGYSPSMAAKRWSTLEDYIKDYESGLFRNGAIPAGMMIVTAPSAEQFNDIVDELEKHHKGAGKNNNVAYAHRPTNELGAPMTAQLEWVPFSEANKDMGLETIFEQSEKARDMIFGVPAEVKGYLQNSNYASATVAERIFDKYVVLPKLIQVWTDFTQEMNRITGGLSCAISFDFDMAVMADEEKVQAETKQIQLNTLRSAIEAGFSMETAVEALELPEAFKNLQNSPNNDKNLVGKTLESKSLNNATKPDSKLEKIAYNELLKQIELAIAEGLYDSTEGLDLEFAEELQNEIIEMAYQYGVIQFGTGVREAELIGLIDVALAGRLSYSLSEEAKNSYVKYLQQVAKSYNADTASSIRKVVEKGVYEEWDKETLATNLRNIMQTDEWRVQRLARTETHRASGVGSLDAMKQLSNDTGIKIVKTFHINPYTTNHCPECVDLDGKSYELDAVISSHETNGFIDQETADVHPNCGCYLTFDIVGAKSVKVTCPKCGRYMFESEGGISKNVICANSKCKRHFDIEVKHGKIKATEVKK